MKELNKKFLTLILVITFTFSPVFAIPARAQWVVFDPSNFANTLSKVIKDYGLDGLAWSIANRVIERMAASTVKWINSGFQGSPAYVTDPDSYFTNIADKVAGEYIYSNPNLNFLCGDMSAKIKLALTRNYTSYNDDYRWRCSLTDVISNVDNFMGDFSQGGWDGFFELTQKTQNNPLGAYLQAENEMYLQIATRQGVTQTELAEGSGFLTYKKCKAGTEKTVDTNGLGSCDQAYNSCISSATTEEEQSRCSATASSCNRVQDSIAVGDCADSDKETLTPGSVIGDKLNEALGSGTKKLEVADEINEIVSSLLNQLVTQVVGGGTGGLRGLSEPSTTNNNQTFTQTLTNNTQTVGYFCFDSTDPTNQYYDTDPNVCKYPDTQDTSVMNSPIPQYNAPNNSTLVWPTSSNDGGVCDPSNPTLYDPTNPACVTTTQP